MRGLDADRGAELPEVEVGEGLQVAQAGGQ